MKLKYTILGNCQAAPIAKLLNAQTNMSDTFEYLPLPGAVHTLKKENLNSIINTLNQIDLFIHQNISETYGKCFSSTALKQHCKKSCQFISIPSLYFTGYFPTFSYLRAIPEANKFSPYHDIDFIEHVLEYNNPVSEYHSKVTNRDYLGKYFVENSAIDSLSKLEKREKNLDIHISDFIEKNWKNEQLFFTINHPSLKVLLTITQKIMKTLELEFIDINWNWEPLKTTVIPTYGYVLKHLNFKKPTKITQSGTTYSLKEYLKSQHQIYKNLDKKALQSSIHKNII
ncbi:WcbI family polysaccharide biosynthesis putative acetyltransferase [Sessilibacter corallicola]|uniref:Polysaccharide biosynthesis enzyme WcbI domain-containing protein n=1 Tax=Sessilibacter corallicola TaxID=2904075 RepID=A0ABQ0A846_9GAMM